MRLNLYNVVTPLSIESGAAGNLVKMLTIQHIDSGKDVFAG